MCTSLPIVPLCCVCKWSHSANVGNTSASRIKWWGTEEKENTTVTHQKPSTWKTELNLLCRELTSPTTEHHQCTSIRFYLWREKKSSLKRSPHLPTNHTTCCTAAATTAHAQYLVWERDYAHRTGRGGRRRHWISSRPAHKGRGEGSHIQAGSNSSCHDGRSSDWRHRPRNVQFPLSGESVVKIFSTLPRWAPRLLLTAWTSSEGSEVPHTHLMHSTQHTSLVHKSLGTRLTSHAHHTPGGCHSHRLYSHSCDRGSKLRLALFGGLTVDPANFCPLTFDRSDILPAKESRYLNCNLSPWTCKSGNKRV